MYTCGLKLGMCAPGGALFRPKNESTTRNACTPQVLLFFENMSFFDTADMRFLPTLSRFGTHGMPVHGMPDILQVTCG